jgi:hypothetical protein
MLTYAVCAKTFALKKVHLQAFKEMHGQGWAFHLEN